VELVAARGDLDRLADGAHAYLVERTAALLEQSGCEIVLEAHTARGSIDALAFHRQSRMLLVVEVKSRLVDLQGTVRTLGRVAAEAASAARRLRWHPTATSVLLVVGDSTTQRSVVERHRATFAIAFPMRTREMRRWLAAPEPDQAVRGLMFFPYASRRDVMQHVAVRVRGPAADQLPIHARSGRRGTGPGRGQASSAA
jgi:hypothetical protein